MKSKLTLSISKDRVRKVKAYAGRRKTSVSEFFEQVIDALGEASSGAPERPKSYRVDELDGLLTGKFTKKDLDKDPRLAHILGRRK